ncbi:MAG: PP2C family protein-serine/threonine phosphatase [Tranquillimonas sp.]
MVWRGERALPRKAAVRTVLVADDSRVQRRIVSAYLTRCGYRVFEAGSGTEGLAICCREEVDLVLSDWVMPGLDGLEFCRALRLQGGARYVYFILLTSKSGSDDIAQALATGADDFLSKPLASEELGARIAAADRILRIERELMEKNRVATDALNRLREIYDALDRDLVEARKLQHSLVPQAPVPLPGATLSFLFRPSGHVGGDLVGYFPASDTRVGVFSLDVSGHGIASALISARLATLLGGATPDSNLGLIHEGQGLGIRPPGDTCAALNRMFLEDMGTEHYFTALIADVDLPRRRLRFVQAGHPPPLIQRRDGRVGFIGDGGFPVGLIDTADFEPVTAQLAPGDRVFLYSDGISECPAPDGGMLGDAGLADLFRRHAPLRGEGLLSALSDELDQLRRGAPLPDDVSGVLLEFG